MVGMGYSYENSIEIITSKDTYRVPKLFSLRSDEEGLLLKNNEVIETLDSCDQVQVMFDFLHLFQDDRHYLERMLERTKVLEVLNSE